MNGVLSDVITSCSSTLGKIFSLLGSCKTCPSDNVVISALVAEGYHWKFEWVAPSMTDSKFWYFFAVDTSSYTLDLWYLYEWNVQVLTSVTVWVVFLYIVWFLSYSCFSSIYVCGPSSWKHAATMQFQKCMNQEQLYYYCIFLLIGRFGLSFGSAQIFSFLYPHFLFFRSHFSSFSFCNYWNEWSFEHNGWWLMEHMKNNPQIVDSASSLLRIMYSTWH